MEQGLGYEDWGVGSFLYCNISYNVLTIGGLSYHVYYFVALVRTAGLLIAYFRTSAIMPVYPSPIVL